MKSVVAYHFKRSLKFVYIDDFMYGIKHHKYTEKYIWNAKYGM